MVSGRHLILCLASLTIASALAANPNPQSFLPRFPDLNSQDTAKLLVADPTGNLFIVSSAMKTSTVTNIHVTKTDGSGNVLTSFDFGGSGMDTPNAAAVDSEGNLVIVGVTQSPNFPLVSPLQKSGAIFVTKINGTLQSIVYSTLLGGGGISASAVALDAAGNIYVTGTAGAGFTTTPGVLQGSAPAPPPDGEVVSGFITEISASGTSLIFSTYFGGAGFLCAGNPLDNPCLSYPGLVGPAILTAPSAIAVDSSGAIVISGVSNANNLPVSQNAYAQQCGCNNQLAAVFVAKIAAGGAQLVWGTYVPINQPPLLTYSPSVTGMALDASGNVIVAGDAQQGLPVTPNALQASYPVPSGSFFAYAGFVVKLNSSGSSLVFATYLGGGSTFSNGIALPAATDSAGTIWLTGSSEIAELPAPAGTPALGTNYIAGLSPDGSSLVSLFTAPNGAAGAAIAITPQGTLAALGSAGSLLISSSTAGPSLMGIAGAASSGISATVCARELLSIYGINIGASSALGPQIANNIISTSLGGVQVLFNGVPAALLYASPTQINAIVPSAVAGQATTTIQIVTPSGAIDGPVLAVQPTQPQVFLNAAGSALALNQDGTVNSASNQAQPGSIVTIWMTGGGALPGTPDDVINTSLSANPYPISMATGFESAGTSPLTVLYAGDAPGLASGVIQVNFQLPATPAANGFPLIVEAGGVTVSFFIQVID
jgi:uncharacterized protein (TIGR03437 family)